MVDEYDLVVIGAGPARESAAQMAANLGYSVALVERDTVGGTVVTNGGAPTKTFREAALYLSGFEKEKVYGVSMAALPEIYNTPTFSYRYKLAGIDALRGLEPEVLRAMRLPSGADRR